MFSRNFSSFLEALAGTSPTPLLFSFERRRHLVCPSSLTKNYGIILQVNFERPHKKIMDIVINYPLKSDQAHNNEGTAEISIKLHVLEQNFQKTVLLGSS